ncbi:Protein ALWAYS EARLY 3 [Quillaja saponaria]|uniref:Protein ALWAYS EARLY 3 n=1 Tax=Quillaja saponaria TaxID=32244 RepID=A0AAD7VF39_QUISA|nr:Protein ALWAYS EARLY 3 [Quillaja saponaria]
MAPTRKSRSVNKRLSSLNEVSPEKDGAKSNKNKQKKKKLSDKLGSPWRKEELERFYEAYRKHGNDWKKVATFIRNRTIEMVEALYNMNRAYLSLPEGTASVVGLIAMMTDHYNVLEGSGSEQESNDESGTRRSLKGKRGRAQLSFSKDLVQSQSIASSDGCLSLLKRRHFDGSQPRAVGKRTPRFPVSYSYKRDDRQNYVSPYKRGRKSEINANDDVVAHVAALALTEASQRGGSPPVSQTAYRRAEHLKSSPVRSWERMKQHSETAGAKINDASIDEDWLEGSTESRGAENGEYGKDTSSLMDMEGVGTVEVHQRGKKFYRKKEKVENDGNHQLDDGGEACSGTEEGLHSSALREKVDIEVNDAKSEQFFLQGQRKRSKKLFFGDESSALDALQTLADLSIIMMPSSMMESESSVQLKEERRNADNKCGLPEATSASQCRGKVKLPSTKQKGLHAVSGVESATSRKSKLGRESAIDDNAVSEAKEQLQYTDKMWKRKRKPSASKIENAKLDSLPSKMLNNEAIAAEENKSAIRAKRSGQSHTHSKQLKSIRSTESSLSSDQKDSILPTAQVPLVNVVSLPATRSRRKMNLQRAFSPREMKSPENRMKNQPNKHYTSYQNRAFYLKEKLSGCLSSYMVRKWCTFEWFYSAIDYPWFAKREFMEYLNHVGLGNIPRLTRVEWSVIKSSLGKPRRFSEHFLHEERQKLEQYRESVRKHYTELRTGIRDGLPTDLAKPLFVGQRVIAIHPKTREVHDGSVLTVDHEKCRVQFARPDIGVEFVKDIDCMPLNPSDNMPEALRRQNAPCKVSFIFKEPQNGHPKSGSCMTSSLSGHLEKAHSPLNALVKQEKGDANCIISQAKAATIDTLCAEQAAYNQPCTVAHNQAREADIQPLTELTRALDKKEALVLELKNTNNEILESQNDMDYLKDSESFKKHYATVSSALHHLRQRNTYTGNSLLPWLKPLVNFSVHDGCPNSCDSSNPQELGSSVTEVIKGSRLRAHTMVGAAIQAFSSRKEGEDAFMRIGQVLDSIDNQQVASNSRLHVIRSQEQVNGSFAHQNQPISCASEPLLSSDVSGVKLCNVSVKNDIQMPSDLITSCVATMLMIQTCTKRQYPPADVAKILDSAVTSLHPCSPQNLPIYREIQMCMGRIKTQILALIPT